MRPIRWVKRISKTWWHVFSQSVFNKEYYSHLPDVPISFSIKFISAFFVLYMLLWSMVASIALSAWVPKLQQSLPQWEQALITQYPEGAVFRIQEGTLSSTMSQPYTLAMPTDAIERESDTFDRANILVIDERATSSDYRKKDTIILITSKEVVVPASRAPETGYEAFPISAFLQKDAGPITITQSSFRL